LTTLITFGVPYSKLPVVTPVPPEAPPRRNRVDVNRP